MPKKFDSSLNVYSFFTKKDVSLMKHISTMNFPNASSTPLSYTYNVKEIFMDVLMRSFPYSTDLGSCVTWCLTLIRSCLSHRVPSGIGARHLCFTGSNLPANVIYLVFNISVISLFSTSSSTSLGAQNRCSEVNLGKQQMKIIRIRNCKKTY